MTLVSKQNDLSFIHADKVVSPLENLGPASVPNPMAQKKGYADTKSQIGFDKNMIFYLPTDGHLIDVSVNQTLVAATAGNFAPYPGINTIKHLKLESGANTLTDVDYAPLWAYCFRLLSSLERTQILTAAGGAAYAGPGDVFAPVPLFFTRWIAPRNIKMPPFPAHKLNADGLKLTLTTRTAAESLAAGATVGPAAISNIQLKVKYAVSVSNDIDVNKPYQSYDFETKDQTVATGTLTSADLLSFSGSVTAIGINNVLATDISTAHKYLTTQAVTEAHLNTTEQDDYYKFESSYEGLQDTFSQMHVDGPDTTLGPYYIIPIGIDNNPKVYNGSINKNVITKMDLKTKHAAGADTTCNFMAIKNAYYVIENKVVKKIVG